VQGTAMISRSEKKRGRSNIAQGRCSGSLGGFSRFARGGGKKRTGERRSSPGHKGESLTLAKEISRLIEGKVRTGVYRSAWPNVFSENQCDGEKTEFLEVS